MKRRKEEKKISVLYCKYSCNQESATDSIVSRDQTKGESHAILNMPKDVKWDQAKIKEGFKRFHDVHKRYPTTRDVDAFSDLPSSRQIQRRFGGLIELRKKLGLDGVSDFRAGEHSSRRAKKINKRTHALEKEVYDYLIDTFGVECVHREYFFTDDRRTRTDFFIYSKEGKFAVDAFYPADRYSFIGCLNSKMKTYGTVKVIRYPVIFLQMNPDITEGEIGNILSRKKNKLRKNQHVMTRAQLYSYCESKTPLKVSSITS